MTQASLVEWSGEFVAGGKERPESIPIQMWCPDPDVLSSDTNCCLTLSLSCRYGRFFLVPLSAVTNHPTGISVGCTRSVFIRQPRVIHAQVFLTCMGSVHAWDCTCLLLTSS